MKFGELQKVDQGIDKLSAKLEHSFSLHDKKMESNSQTIIVINLSTLIEESINIVRK